MQDPRYAEVVVDLPTRRVDRPFTYRVPEALQDLVHVGTAVLVPFHSKELPGMVVGLGPATEDVRRLRAVKEIRSVLDPQALLPADLLELAAWMSAHYGATFHEALQCVVPGPVREATARRQRQPLRPMEVALTDAPVRPVPLTTAQTRAVEALRALGGRLPLARFLEETGLSRSVVTRLAAVGMVTLEQSVGARSAAGAQGLGLPHDADPLALSAPQRDALAAILDPLGTGRHQVVLVHGVTGSGKTEVYLQAIAAALAAGRTAIVLVPEIALTPQAIDRYRGRFGDRLAVIHSGLSGGERRDAWWRIRQGQAQVVLGARSAVFAPLGRLGLIVVDEEHEPSYKQESNPRYHARQVAIMRARRGSAVVVLGSATPAVESVHAAGTGAFVTVRLPERVQGRPLPTVIVVDMRKAWADRRQQERERRLSAGAGTGLFSPVLLEKVRDRLSRGEQMILFLNRRGYSTVILCRDCGHVEKCRSCDIAMTYHQTGRTLACHYCFARRPAPDQCAACGGSAVKYGGSGTQRVEEELLQIFPDCGILRMDADTTGRRGDHARILSAFARGEAPVLLGTQMVAKGLDFPGVTLVGVVSADTALHLPDFRAGERAFQLLTQVAGRAGRGPLGGEVVIQTYQPDHPSIVAAARQDYQLFYDQEIEARKLLGYPPFSRLVNVMVSGPGEEAVVSGIESIAAALRPVLPDGVTLLGPAPCALSRIRGHYRWHLLLKHRSGQELGERLRSVLASARMPEDVLTAVDVDPLSLL